MQSWEYLEATIDLDKKSWKDSAGRARKVKKKSTVDILNELGGEGWELAGVAASGDDVSRLYFKRPRTEGEGEPEVAAVTSPL
jgi:hypothetical protein